MKDSDACEKFGVMFLTYTLMDNHVHMILQGDIKKFQHACELVGRPLRGSLMRNMAGQGLFDPRYFKRCRCTNGKVGDESNNRRRSL